MKSAKPFYDAWYSQAPWRRLRRYQLNKEPLCQMCKSLGIIKAATIVDHIKPHKGNETLFLNPDNLQSICQLHHDADCAQMECGTWQAPTGLDGWPQSNEYLDMLVRAKAPKAQSNKQITHTHVNR